MPEFGTGVRLRATDPRYLEILDFLWDEAAILDRDDLAEWRDMLDVNLSYRMPVCLTRKRASQESYETEAMHYDEDYPRSEEHTSELQSLMRISYAVFCLKKKKKK